MNPRLPMFKARDVERVLRKLGFNLIDQKGSHAMWEHPDGRFTTVPRHGGEDIGRGLLRQMLREVEISPDEFIKYI
jgi:predicted RNA binding protein YcfA (HicA-like mRNA interferase family)